MYTHYFIYMKAKNRPNEATIEIRIRVTWGVLMGKEHEGAFWDAGNVLYQHCPKNI